MGDTDTVTLVRSYVLFILWFSWFLYHMSVTFFRKCTGSLQAKINYWCREKHYRHMQNAALEGLRKYGNDPILKFFNAYSLILEGNYLDQFIPLTSRWNSKYSLWRCMRTCTKISGRAQEAIRELEMLKDKRDVNLCSLMALMYAHKMARVIGEAMFNFTPAVS